MPGLSEKTIVLGLSGGIACYKGAELVRSRRDGKMVMYALTDTGTSLLATVLGKEEVPA